MEGNLLRLCYYFTCRKKGYFCFCFVYCKQIMHTTACSSSNGATLRAFRTTEKIQYWMGKFNSKIYLSKQMLEKWRPELWKVLDFSNDNVLAIYSLKLRFAFSLFHCLSRGLSCPKRVSKFETPFFHETCGRKLRVSYAICYALCNSFVYTFDRLPSIALSL